MGAMLGRMIGDYKGLVEVCQQRAIELGLSRHEIDFLGGLPAGYAGKLLGKGNSENRKRTIWPIGLEAMLGALGLRILLIEDDAATARTLKLRRSIVDSSNQRFGNKCNSKPALCIESIEPVEIAVPRNEPPAPASRAHLRVIQGKRKGRHDGSRRYGDQLSGAG
jgi:hypothetical protein